MSEPAWLAMVDDDEADVYETLRAMHRDKAASEYPMAVHLVMKRAGERLEAELTKELPGLRISLLRIDPDQQWMAFKVSFYMLGGWTQWTRALSVSEIVFRNEPGEPVSESVAHLFVIDAARYFANRIKKGETDAHTG